MRAKGLTNPYLIQKDEYGASPNFQIQYYKSYNKHNNFNVNWYPFVNFQGVASTVALAWESETAWIANQVVNIKGTFTLNGITTALKNVEKLSYAVIEFTDAATSIENCYT